MMNRIISRLLVLVGLVALTLSCAKPTFEKLADGVVVHLQSKEGQAKQVKLRVVSDDIIQVIASPVDSFSTRKSLMVVPDLKLRARGP